MDRFEKLLQLPPLFAGFTREEANFLLDRAGVRFQESPKDSLLLGQGDCSGDMGLVLTGRVHILREDFWGNRSILSTVEPGGLFGESYACLPPRPMGVSVLAAQPCQVLFLSGHSLLRPFPEPNLDDLRLRASQNLIGILAHKNLMLTQKMEHLTQRSIRQKVLSYLSAQSQLHGSPEFTIPYNRQQLADYLAVDRSALSSQLGALRREGVLSFRRSHFILFPK